MPACLKALHVGILCILVALISAAARAAEPPTRRASIDLTAMTNVTRTIPAALVTPAMAQNIGPGSHLLIDIPGAGTFGCTANFVWAAGSARYLGAAGHCFIPAGTTATHGPGADFNASGVIVRVCVSNCSFGGETGFTLTGNLVSLGAVAYARQTAASGDIGNDFGVVAIPAALASMIRPSMPVFGGPTTIDTIDTGEPVCHYGNGVIVGEAFVTMARVGRGSDAPRDRTRGVGLRHDRGARDQHGERSRPRAAGGRSLTRRRPGDVIDVRCQTPYIFASSIAVLARRSACALSARPTCSKVTRPISQASTRALAWSGCSPAFFTL
jgi:hypothetical protein